MYRDEPESRRLGHGIDSVVNIPRAKPVGDCACEDGAHARVFSPASHAEDDVNAIHREQARDVICAATGHYAVPVLAHFHSARLVRCGTEWRVPAARF